MQYNGTEGVTMLGAGSQASSGADLMSTYAHLAGGGAMQQQLQHQHLLGQQQQQQQQAGSPANISTVFCAGLPHDMTAREFRNLFMFAAGIEQCVLIYTKSGRPVGYARFQTPQLAQVAISVLHGSPTSKVPGAGQFRCELSTFQLDDANPPLSYPPPAPQMPTMQAPSLAAAALAMGLPPTDPYAAAFYASAASAMPVPGVGMGAPLGGGRFVQNLKGIPENCPPCDTLYITNLSKWTQEAEILQLTGQCMGLVAVKFVQRQDKLPICFLKFSDKHCAAIALQQLAGNSLASTSGVPINVAFSKTELNLNSQCTVLAPTGMVGRYPPVTYNVTTGM